MPINLRRSSRAGLRRDSLGSETEEVEAENAINQDFEFNSSEALSPLCDPRTNLHRCIFLTFLCLMGFGSNFCYDNPGALQDKLMTDLNLTTSQFAQLYSWYSWPNVIGCFLGGYLLDRVFGMRLGTVIYCALLVIGQIIFAIGGLLNQFWLMIVGRFIFGLGGESLNTAQNTYAVSWFKSKELNCVFGIVTSIARVGSTVNFNVMELLYDEMREYYTGYTCTGIVLMISASAVITSLISAIILAWLDFRAEKILDKPAFGTNERVQFRDIKYFPVPFWLICTIYAAYSLAIIPFVGLGKNFFKKKFHYSPEEANAVNSILYIISVIASPILGIIQDATGKNVFWIFLSILSTILAHTLLAFTSINPYVGMVFMGLGYAIISGTLWSMVSLVVAEYQLGTAYGLIASVTNFGIAAGTWAAGSIVDSSGYILLEEFFIAWLCCALVLNILLWLYDWALDGILNMTVEQRDKRDMYERIM